MHAHPAQRKNVAVADVFDVSPATASTGARTNQHGVTIGGATVTTRDDEASDNDSVDFAPPEDAQPVVMVGPFEVRQTIRRAPDHVVKLGVHSQHGTLHEIRVYALSAMKSDPMLRLRVEREVLALRNLVHPFVLRLDDVLYSRTHLFVVTEFCQGGELFDVLATHGQQLLATTVVARMLLQLVTAVAFMHGKGVAHRDIKLEHVFLDARNTIKLAGLSSAGVAGSVPAAARKATDIDVPPPPEPHAGAQRWTVEPSGSISKSASTKARGAVSAAGGAFGDLLFTVPCGSQHYVAPEVLECGLAAGQHVTREDVTGQQQPQPVATYDGRPADMWSCGVVLFAMATGHLPFQAPTDAELFAAIRHRTFNPSAVPALVSLPKALADLIYGMLDVDPRRRLTCGDVLRHPFWTSPPVVASTVPAAAAATMQDDEGGVPEHQHQQQRGLVGPSIPQTRSSSRGNGGYADRAAAARSASSGGGGPGTHRDRGQPVIERLSTRRGGRPGSASAAMVAWV